LTDGGLKVYKMKIEKEIKKVIEKITEGDKVQLELDKKNNCLKIWKLKLSKVEVKTGETGKEGTK